jgi:hypothetical protein
VHLVGFTIEIYYDARQIYKRPVVSDKHGDAHRCQLMLSCARHDLDRGYGKYFLGTSFQLESDYLCSAELGGKQRTNRKESLTNERLLAT